MHKAEHDLKVILYTAYAYIIDCALFGEIKSNKPRIHLNNNNDRPRNLFRLHPHTQLINESDNHDKTPIILNRLQQKKGVTDLRRCHFYILIFLIDLDHYFRLVMQRTT